MLKIAPNPDAAYEICTVFAPDCRHQSRTHRPNDNSSSGGSRGYESYGTRSTSSSRATIIPGSTSHVSTTSSGVFSIGGLAHRESALNANVSDGSLTANGTSGGRESYENAIGESEYDYEEEDENGNFYTSPHVRFTNVTYVLRPTMESTVIVRNHSTVRVIRSNLIIFRGYYKNAQRFRHSTERRRRPPPRARTRQRRAISRITGNRRWILTTKDRITITVTMLAARRGPVDFPDRREHPGHQARRASLAATDWPGCRVHPVHRVMSS